MSRLLALPQALLAVGIAIALSACSRPVAISAAVEPVPASTASVSGSATGLKGTLVLLNNGADSLTFSAAGAFEFSTPIASGSAYAVTVQTQPSGQTCTVSNGAGTMGAAAVTNVAVLCVSNTYAVGGTVSGLNGTVILQNNGTDAKTISGSGAFTFATPVVFRNPYTVTVKTQPSTQTCLVTNGTGTIGAAAVTNVSVICVSNTFTVGGAVSGLTGTVVLQNNGHNAQPISTDGIFIFPSPIVTGSHYVVTVLAHPVGQTCSVGNASGTMGAAPVTNVAVVCAANTHTIGAAVSGLVGSVVLQNNGIDNRTISTDGASIFSTPVAEGSTYAVTVLTQPVTEICTVSNGSGTVGSVDVSNVTVVCSINAYTVGGTVSGLSGTVTLQNNAGNSTPLSTNGSFALATPVAQGSTYDVTVQTQPAPQRCTVTNGAGTMGASAVTNVSVDCATPNPTTLIVDAMGVVPVNGGPGTITVTNTGTTDTAFNVSATLPGGWIGVTQDASNCTAIAPNGGTCTLSFTSTTPYVAQGNIALTGDNVSTPPTTALAFSLDGYLVYAVPTASTALVIASSDAPGMVVWSSDLVTIPGISETSTVAGGDACDGATDGSCNTAQIVAHYGTPYGDYAAAWGQSFASGYTVQIGWYKVQPGSFPTRCARAIAY